MDIKKGKILVIEDHPDWWPEIKEFLESDGFHVDVALDLESALVLVESERFHFITIDMQLNEKTIDGDKFEGWSILQKIKKLRTQDTTPCMVMTGFGIQYQMLKKNKEVEGIFFMEKAEFDKIEFLKIINREVKRMDLRFKNDYRGD